MASPRQGKEALNGTEALLRRQKRRRPFAWWASMALLLAFAGVIGWFAWTAGLFVSDRATAPKVKVTVLDEHRIVVRGTDIAGLDENSQPFTVTARVSERFDADRNLIHLTDVKGEMKKKDGETITFTAARAVYYRKEELVDLEGDVHIESPGRYVLLTPKARIVVRTKELTSDSPVTVTLSDGVIHARGIRTGRNADRIVFRGRVSATFGNGPDRAGKARKTDRAPAARSE